MRLVIRAEVPITLAGILEPIRRMAGTKSLHRTSQEEKWMRVKEIAEPFRAICNQEQWAREEAALEELQSAWLCDMRLFVQTLPVPVGLPIPFLQLLTGLSIKEEASWSPATFSPLAMLWLREAGVQPLGKLDGQLLRIESGEGMAVIQLGGNEAKPELPIVRERKDHAQEHIDEGMLIMQVNLDDSSPEWLAYVMELCFRAGANDVHFLPVTMKKSRPGTLLQVMCYQSQVDALKTLLFAETTTFGIRYFPVACHRLARRFVTVMTEWGEVTVKLGYHLGKRVQVAPEYAVCAQVAEAVGVPLKQVYQQAVRLGQEESSVNLP